MRSVWQSSREWGVAVGTAWFAWAIAILTGLVDGAKAVFPGLDAPRSALIAGYAAAFVAANIKAFHEMRLRAVAPTSGDSGRATHAPAPNMTDAAGLALLEPARELEGHETESRGTLRRLGMANPLVGRFQVSNFAPPLQHDEQACVIRLVLAASNPPEGTQLTSQIKSDFKAELQRSTLEAWFVDQTLTPEGLAAVDIDWTRDSPNTGYVTTSKRPCSVAVADGSLLCGKATLQLPAGALFGDWLIVILDVIERAAERETSGASVEQDTGSSPRLRLTLDELHHLLHGLARTAIDEVGPAVFPTIFGDGAPTLVGPNYEINFGDRSLGALLWLPRNFERTAAGQDLPWAYVNTPDDSDPRDLGARDTVIRRGLESMLRQNEYDGIEDTIAALPTPGSRQP